MDTQCALQVQVNTDALIYDSAELVCVCVCVFVYVLLFDGHGNYFTLF